MRRSRQEWLGVITVKVTPESSMDIRPEYGNHPGQYEVTDEERYFKLSSFKTVARGGQSSVTVDPKTLFKNILEDPCEGFFLFHNHPSGSTIPSSADLKLSAQVLQVCMLLDLIFLGHAIVTAKQLHWIDLETIVRDCYGPKHHEYEFETDPLPH